MRKFVILLALSGFLALGIAISSSYASEVDALLQKLIDKGVLSASEAQEIRTETNEEAARIDKQKEEDYKKLAKTILPDWVQNTTLKGDFRLRYAYNHVNGGTESDKQRARLRLRVGFETKVNDKLTLGVGLATGLSSSNDSRTDGTGNLTSDYARSANQTFTGAFSKKPINLDLAYAKYTPQPWASFVGGMMVNPFWDPEGKFVWDDNIRPEGFALLLNKSWDSHLTTFLNAGYFVLDQNTGMHNAPNLYAFQPGAAYNFNDNLSLKGAVSLYNWQNIKGRNLPGSSYDSTAISAAHPYQLYGNSRDLVAGVPTNVINGFNNVIPQVEFGIKHPLSRLFDLDSVGLSFLDVPYLSLFGEYMVNTQVSKSGTGYVLGFKLGSEKIDKWGDWQLQCDYRKIEADAIPDILPDADFYNSIAGGTTGVSGNRFVFDWGLGKNNWLELNLYRDEAFKLGGQQETTFYADWKMKF